MGAWNVHGSYEFPNITQGGAIPHWRSHSTITIKLSCLESSQPAELHSACNLRYGKHYCVLLQISITGDARIAQAELTNVLTRRDFDTIVDQWVHRGRIGSLSSLYISRWYNEWHIHRPSFTY